MTFFLTALLTITRIMNKINNREEMKYMCRVIRSDEVKRAGANGTRGPMRGTAHKSVYTKFVVFVLLVWLLYQTDKQHLCFLSLSSINHPLSGHCSYG